jgi:tetratricopeptide (TPR) repeat protein
MNCKILLTLLTLFSFSAIAQTEQEIEKKFSKADKLAQSNKADDAEKLLTEFAQQYPGSAQIWDKLVTLQLDIYQSKKSLDGLMGNVTITTKGADGKEVENDTTSQKLAEFFKTFKPSDLYLNNNLLLSCRKACQYTNEAYVASIVIRNKKIDKPNSAYKNDAIKYFNAAEQEFAARNYNKAATLYQKALDADPSFYKAKLYLGDVYYMTKEYDKAITAFKEAVLISPTLLEPRKYLSDAYSNSGMYKEAFDAGIQALMAYPDATMFAKVEIIGRKRNVPIDFHWMKRGVLPNSMDESYAITAKDAQPKKAEGAWKLYQEAKNEIAKTCNDKGIVPEAKDNKAKYLEVFSWDYMLTKTNDPQFDFAKKMQQKGFLDCYALLSCYHIDFYDQFRDFSDNNKEKIQQYIALLQEESKR